MRIQRNTIYLNNMLQFIKPKTGKYEFPKGYWPDLNLFGAVISLYSKQHERVSLKNNETPTRVFFVSLWHNKKRMCTL